MLYPGLKNLGNADLAAINAATGGAVITSAPDIQGVTVAYIDRLEGMLAATLIADFKYGSGGTTMKLLIETSVDQGGTWIEVARLAFATASLYRAINLSGLTPKNPTTPGALSDDTVLDGIFGARMRARIVTTGVYAGNTSLAVRLEAR